MRIFWTFCKSDAWTWGSIYAYDIKGCEDEMVVNEEVLNRMKLEHDINYI